MRVRVFAAIICVGAAAVGALAVHDFRESHKTVCGSGGTWNFGSPCVVQVRPGWADPAAVGVLFVGLAAGSAVMTRRTRKAATRPEAGGRDGPRGDRA